MIDLHNLHVLLGFLDFLVWYLLWGLLVARFWLVPPAAWAEPLLVARWTRVLQECLTLLIFAGVALLFARTAEMNDASPTPLVLDVLVVLAKTHFGLVWCVHLAALGALWAGCRAYLKTADARWAALMALALLLIAFTYSASSHAADLGDFTLAELNDLVHVVATATWGGAIFASAFILFPTLRGREAELAEVAVRLSRLSAITLAFVLATGVYNSSLQLRSLAALTATDYGRILTAKLAIVGTLMVIGAVNRVVISARIERRAVEQTVSQPLQLVSRTLAVDAVLVVLAIVMAAILGQNETS